MEISKTDIALQGNSSGFTRSKIVMERCEKLQYFEGNPSTIISDNGICQLGNCRVFIIEELNALYCDVPKAASTTTKAEIFKLLNFDLTMNPQVAALQHFVRAAPLHFNEVENSHLKYFR